MTRGHHDAVIQEPQITKLTFGQWDAAGTAAERHGPQHAQRPRVKRCHGRCRTAGRLLFREDGRDRLRRAGIAANQRLPGVRPPRLGQWKALRDLDPDGARPGDYEAGPGLAIVLPAEAMTNAGVQYQPWSAAVHLRTRHAGHCGSRRQVQAVLACLLRTVMTHDFVLRLRPGARTIASKLMTLPDPVTYLACPKASTATRGTSLGLSPARAAPGAPRPMAKGAPESAPTGERHLVS